MSRPASWSARVEQVPARAGREPAIDLVLVEGTPGTARAVDLYRLALGERDARELLAELERAVARVFASPRGRR